MSKKVIFVKGGRFERCTVL